MIKNNYINGEWTPGDEGCRENVNPSNTNEVIGLYARSSVALVDEAVSAALRAYPAWSRTSPQLRADLLESTAAVILSRSAALGELLAREEGKTLKEATAEVVRAAQIFRFFSGEALRMAGVRQPSTRSGVVVNTHREAVGVVGLITPWNFPIAIPAWKAAPALAFGNTVVLKPADLTPASAHALTAILDEVGFPPGVFNLVMGPGSTVGDAISRHPDVNAVTFTGSEQVGIQVATICAARLAKVQLELGGKNPLVVLADADLDNAVDVAIQGAFYSTGQRCTASSRLIVEAPIYEEFVDRMFKRMDALIVGDALAPTTQIGPVVDQKQLESNSMYLNIARSTPGSTVYGGELLDRENPGFFLSPAMILGASNSDRTSREEIFGPVTSVIRANDYDEAVAFANETEYGLVAGICTTSLARAEDFQSRAQTGMVMVNVPTAGVDPHVAFGGRKRSSYGPHEQGTSAQEFFTETKTAYIRP